MERLSKQPLGMYSSLSSSSRYGTALCLRDAKFCGDKSQKGCTLARWKLHADLLLKAPFIGHRVTSALCSRMAAMTHSWLERMARTTEVPPLGRFSGVIDAFIASPFRSQVRMPFLQRQLTLHPPASLKHGILKGLVRTERSPSYLSCRASNKGVKDLGHRDVRRRR